MGVESFQYINFASGCHIKKQLHVLQQKIDEVKCSQINGQTANRRFLKEKLLKEASKISEVILENHDVKGFCKCFNVGNVQDFVKNAEEKNLQLMLDYLHKLNGFLWQLDTEVTTEKPVSSKKPLNPLSKSFIPKYLCITENPEFQCDYLPHVSKDVDTSVLQNDKSTEKLNFQNQTHQKKTDAMRNESYSTQNCISSDITFNNLNFVAVADNKFDIDLDDMKVSTSAVQTNIYKQNVDCYDKLLKYEDEIKALWSSLGNANKPTLNQQLKPEPCAMEKFVDRWSVKVEDKKLLNPRILFKPCGCPPCFGYNIPPTFWGNPFKLKQLCSEQEIHLSCYEGNCKQLQNIPSSVEIPQTQEFSMETTAKNFAETEKFREFRLNKHKKDFQRFVSDVVCDITKVLNKPDSTEKVVLMDQKQKIQRLNYTGIPQGSSLYLGSIDKHDMLNGFNRCARLGQQHQKHPRLIRQLCNTPCSVWCDFNKDKTWDWSKVANDLHKKSQTNGYFELKDKTAQSSENLNTVSEGVGETFDNLENISRDDESDSGYDSATMCSTSSFSNTRNDGSLDLESEFWTPLPDCISHKKEGFEKYEKSGYRKFMKNQKSRTKNFNTLDQSVEQKSRSIIDEGRYKTTKFPEPIMKI